MLEVFLILIIIYVAYVTYSGAEEDEQINNVLMASGDKVSLQIPLKAKASKKTMVRPKKAVTKTKPVTAKVESVKPSKSKVKKVAAPKIELRTVEMKNPKTGEQAKVANNYRMVKRWIKEALVEEGLLDKIYKTNEMDDTAKAEVAKALSIIKAMDKYKV